MSAHTDSGNLAFKFCLLWRNFFGGDLFQVCAGTQCELEEVCMEEQRKVARKVNISTCFQVCKTEEKKLTHQMLLQVPKEVCRLSEEPTCHIIHKLLPQLKEHKTCNKVKI